MKHSALFTACRAAVLLLVSSLHFILQFMLYVTVALEAPIPAPAGVVLVIFSLTHTLAVRLVKGRLSPPSKRVICWTEEAVQDLLLHQKHSHRKAAVLNLLLILVFVFCVCSSVSHRAFIRDSGESFIPVYL